MNEAPEQARGQEKQAVLLEEDIIRLEAELSDRYYQLGKSIYEAADRRVDEINRLVDRLVEAKVKLADTQGHVTCLSCLADNPKDNLYCGRCGQRLEGPEQP